MDLGLAGRTAVVTGAGRGVGLAVVRALAAEGVRVVGCARTITGELKDTGAVPVSADLATVEGTRHLADAARTVLGGIDLLVNNVGGSDRYNTGGFLALDDADWQRTFDVNFYSAVRVTRAVLPDLVERRGRIVNISSTGAKILTPQTVDYGAAKAALNALGKALDEEFGPQGVRVNTISPGPVRTSFWQDPDGVGAQIAASLGTGLPELVQRVPSVLGLTTGRIAEPEEVAALVLFLLSDRAGGIAGTDVRVDNGMVKTV